jgi:hypothetical protein
MTLAAVPSQQPQKHITKDRVEELERCTYIARSISSRLGAIRSAPRETSPSVPSASSGLSNGDHAEEHHQDKGGGGNRECDEGADHAGFCIREGAVVMHGGNGRRRGRHERRAPAILGVGADSAPLRRAVDSSGL